MSDLEYSAGNKVVETDNNKIISGKINENAGENAPGPKKFFRISKKPLVEKSSPNDSPESHGQGNLIKDQQLRLVWDSNAPGTPEEDICDEDMELELAELGSSEPLDEVALGKESDKENQASGGMVGSRLEESGGKMMDGGQSVIGLVSTGLNNDSGPVAERSGQSVIGLVSSLNNDSGLVSGRLDSGQSG